MPHHKYKHKKTASASRQYEALLKRLQSYSAHPKVIQLGAQASCRARGFKTQKQCLPYLRGLVAKIKKH
jgi:hypothetical protein